MCLISWLLNFLSQCLFSDLIDNRVIAREVSTVIAREVSTVIAREVSTSCFCVYS